MARGGNEAATALEKVMSFNEASRDVSPVALVLPEGALDFGWAGMTASCSGCLIIERKEVEDQIDQRSTGEVARDRTRPTHWS